uniref:coiled-coil domain-containing protein 12-like n=1 Tax=Arvicanthis niloticus TaxID=61156 RepID=UPI0014870AA8|nr:coiled-coil domain-containing protein 12-like [Arvicanthis niloticus]
MAAVPAGVCRLKEEAWMRKEQLKDLREKAGCKDRGDGKLQHKRLGEEEEEPREPRFQNYVPEDRDLKRWQVPQAKPVAVEEKRDVPNKLEKLEKRTQKAISELSHERLKGH